MEEFYKELKSKMINNDEFEKVKAFLEDEFYYRDQQYARILSMNTEIMSMNQRMDDACKRLCAKVHMLLGPARRFEKKLKDQK